MNPARRIYPLLALALLALAFVALVALSSVALRGARVDLTENGMYTLADGTIALVRKLDEPVRLKLYYSEQATREMAELQQFRVFAERVRELLEELVARSEGKLTLEVIDPEPFSEAEDQAAAYGLTALPLNTAGDKLYFGLVSSGSTGRESVMPFIQPSKESFLEYDVAKLVSTLDEESLPVAAVISGLPTGPSVETSGQPVPGWVTDTLIGQQVEMRRLQGAPTEIADDVDLLIVIHPKDLPEDTQYAIDQFVLRGGRLLAFVDPDAESDTSGVDPLDPLSASVVSGSDLPQLFAGWGIRFAPDQVVLDDTVSLQVQPDPRGPPLRHLAVLGLGPDNLNQDDVVSAALESVNVSSAGALELGADATLTMEPLAQSSAAAALAPATRVRENASTPDRLREGFQPGGGPFVLAARFSGPLKTAFPQRSGEGHLAESNGAANIIVVADTDVLNNRLWVQVSDFLGQQVQDAFANNGDFVLNAVDNLVGNPDLIAVRTRGTASRPFDHVESLRRAAEQRYRAKELELQGQIDELEAQLSQLQQVTPDGQAQPMSPEQQAQVARFQDERLRVRKELREVQRRLNADIEDLGTFLTRVNVLAMPLLVILVSLLVAAWRWSRRRPGEA